MTIIKELLIQEIVTNNANPALNSSPTLNSDGSAETQTRSADPWDAVLVDTESSEEESCENTILPVRKQVSEYLKEKRVSLKSDPLDYWKSKMNQFPLISPLVRKYLSAPPASTSVERLFSVAGNTVTTKRLSLKPENLESNIFLNYNLRAQRTILKIHLRTSLPLTAVMSFHVQHLFLEISRMPMTMSI